MPDPAKQAEIRVGDIRITYLPDGEARFAPTALFPASTPEAWQAHRRWLDDEGRLVTTFGGFLIQTGDRKVLIDTGFGEKHVEFPGFGPLSGGNLLRSLASAGCKPEEIDTVFYTHLHLDHVGWTSVASGAGRTLTFPNARYLIRQPEWEYWTSADNPAGPDPVEVRQPIEGHMEMVEDGQAIAPGINLIATPGHTPGHMSVVVSSGDQRAIILGDVVHCPVQLDEPNWACVFDVDQDLGRRTRERLLEELANPNSVGAAGHFSEFVFGRVMRGAGKLHWQGGIP